MMAFTEDVSILERLRVGLNEVIADEKNEDSRVVVALLSVLSAVRVTFVTPTDVSRRCA